MRSWQYWWGAVCLAINNLRLRGMRSALALLGVILGVGSVIAMLAIGEGSKAKAMAQIEALGATNVIVRSVKPGTRQQAAEEESTSGQRRVSRIVEYGLKYADFDRLCGAIPTLTRAVPVALVRKDVYHGHHRIRNARILGVNIDYMQVRHLQVRRGRFIAATDLAGATNVVVLGPEAADLLFGYEDPIGKDLFLGSMSFRVVGVLAPGGQNADPREIFIPLDCARRRFGELQVIKNAGSVDYEKVQLSEIILTARSLDLVGPTAEMAKKLLHAQHARSDDYEVQVPLELQERAEQEHSLWNLVLGSIAGISLLVGGIGIMNIMLANVTEQTREIGIRRALGARRHDIIIQFLIEAIALCSLGGGLGVLLGIGAPTVVEKLAGIEAIVHPSAVLLAFSISSLMGIVFGIYPAARAAYMDPITALRHVV